MLPAPLTPRRVVLNATALALWLTTVVVGLVEVYFMRQAFFRVASRAGVSASAGLLGADVLLLVLALVWVVFTYATGEFHRKHAGEPRSWQLFGWTVVTQAVLFVLYLIA